MAAPASAATIAEADTVEPESADEPEADPYEISEFITPPPDDGKVHSNTEAPLTAAEDEPAAETAAVSTESAGEDRPADTPPAARFTASTDTMSPQAPYRGTCPDGSSTAQAADWQSLSVAQRNAFPRPTLGISAYSPDPQRRFVMAGGRLFREGQTLPSGVKLLHMGPKTLVLVSGGCAVEIPLRLMVR